MHACVWGLVLRQAGDQAEHSDPGRRRAMKTLTHTHTHEHTHSRTHTYMHAACV